MLATLVNILRISIALQAVGIGLRYLGLWSMWEDESPVFGLLLFDWQWPQTTAQRIDDAGAWAYLICGMALVAIPLCSAVLQRMTNRSEPLLRVATWQLPLCFVVALWQFVLTAVTWYRGGLFMSEWTFAAQAARLALPVALIVLTPLGRSAVISARRMSIAIWILRIAVCLTFFGHGLKAIRLHGEFTNYLVAAAQCVSWDVTQATAETVLRVIGVIDLLLAAAIVTTRWRTVAYYMAFWALITAFARVVHSGWGAQFEVLIRAGNYCVPLVIGLYWQLTRQDHLPETSHHESPTDDRNHAT
jgi:hypothetical protein